MPLFHTRRPGPIVRRRSLTRSLRLDPMECRLTPSHTATINATTLTGPEGTAVELTSTVTGATSPTYSWSVTRDGDAFTLPAGTVTDADTFTFTPDDDGSYEVTLTVTDGGTDAGGGHTATDTETLTITNVAPTATLTGPSVAVPGFPMTFTLGATDASAVDQASDFTFNINWGDGSPAQTVIGPVGTTVTHTFSTTGGVTVSATATDKDGGVSDPATLALQVKTAAVIDDPLNPGKKLLAVGGTDGADNINLIPGGRAGSVRVMVGGRSAGAFASFDRIAVMGLGGNDRIHLAGSIRTAAWLDGGDGNDRLKGGKGNDVLLGGAGDDHLDGSQGHDVMIGGAGADRMLGGPGDDLMIASTTSYDADMTALSSIAGLWNGTGTLANRVDALRTSSTVPLALGGSSPTVFDDGAADQLTGAAGGGWVFADPTQDQVTGNVAGLFVNDATAPATHGNGNGHGTGGGHGNH
jgi:hypothetical protein